PLGPAARTIPSPAARTPIRPPARAASPRVAGPSVRAAPPGTELAPCAVAVGFPPPRTALSRCRLRSTGAGRPRCRRYWIRSLELFLVQLVGQVDHCPGGTHAGEHVVER